MGIEPVGGGRWRSYRAKGPFARNLVPYDTEEPIGINGLDFTRAGEPLIEWEVR